MEMAFASFSVDLIFKPKYDTPVNIRSLKETKGVLKGSLSGKKQLAINDLREGSDGASFMFNRVQGICSIRESFISESNHGMYNIHQVIMG